jgi:predicted deacylase
VSDTRIPPAETAPAAAATASPVELVPPDISAYRAGNTGIDFVHRFDSGRAGPRAMITAIVHGNELCGAIALDRLLQSGFRPRCGSLTLVFANPRAYATFDPTNPTAARFIDEDLNRLWAPEVLEFGKASAELARARELRPLVDTADLLLDLHSMQHDTQPLALSGPSRKGRAFAVALGLPHLVIADAGHAAGLRLRDYGGFNRPEDPRNAVLVECGQHWRRGTETLAIRVVERFLQHLGMADALPGSAPGPADTPNSRRCIQITRAVSVRNDDARFAAAWRGLEVIPHAGTPILYDGADTVRTPYDECVLVMPARRLHRGLTAVRLGRFIDCESPHEV